MIDKVYQKVGKTPSMIDKSYRKNIDLDDYIIDPGKGNLITGGAGCGKITKLINDAKESKNPIIFSFTNKALDNIRSRVDNSLKNKVHTFDSYFDKHISDAENLKLLTNKDIFIDEFSMVPNKWITLIYHSYMANNLEVNLYGDANQCDPVEGSSRLKYDYTKGPAILEMCPNTIELKYIEESARYDKKTFDMLTNFLQTGRLNQKLANYTDTFVNICYFNSTRKEINKMCSDAFCEGTNHLKINFSYNGSKEEYKVCAGTPVICIDNMKDRGMFNSQQFTIKDISINGVSIKENDQKFSLDEFRKKFNLAFCMTVYKYQGAEIDQHYNIFDTEAMNKKQLYTALSRTTKFEYIHAENLNAKYTYNSKNKHEVVSIGHTEYQKGKIYKIEFDDGTIYIGSTIKTIETRLKEHLSDTKSIVYKNKDKSPKISLVIDCPCENKHKLEKIEKKHINDYARKHGNKVLNKRGNEEIKEKPEIKYSFKIEKEEDLINRIEKMLAIENDEKNK